VSDLPLLSFLVNCLVNVIMKLLLRVSRLATVSSGTLNSSIPYHVSRLAVVGYVFTCQFVCLSVNREVVDKFFKKIRGGISH